MAGLRSESFPSSSEFCEPRDLEGISRVPEALAETTGSHRLSRGHILLAGILTVALGSL